jgi:hypothetical protein
MLLQSSKWVYLVNDKWKLVKKHSGFEYFWHGSQSIDQSENGVIMFSEYTGTKETNLKPLKVWASYDEGKSFEAVLTLNSSPNHKAADLRHFHTCFADLEIKGRWYVTTGDRLDNNRLYISDDDGKNWERIAVNKIAPTKLIQNRFKNNILRFTSCFFKGDYIYWATDDLVGLSQPCYVRMNRKEVRKGEYEILSFFDNNLIRSVIPDEEGGCLTISESKFDLSEADIHYVDNKNSITTLKSIPNRSGNESGTTLSLNSLKFNNGIAYSLHDVNLFAEKQPGILKYELKRLEENSLEYSFLKKYRKIKTAVDPLIVFFHAQRTAGTTLKDIFKKEYGDEQVYYQRTVDDFKPWKDLTDQDLQDYKVYGAHDNFSDENLSQSRARFYISVIRDPIERAKSLYNYLKTRPEHKLHQLAMDQDIYEFYKKAYEISPNYVSDVQTLRVCGKKDFDYAKNIIEKHFSLLAPFEKIDEIVKILEEFFEFRKKGGFKKKEVNPNSLSDLDEKTIKLIEEINKEDIKLYNYIKELYKTIKPLIFSVARQNF